MYLAVDKLPDMIARYYSNIEPEARLVGIEPQQESGYFDIVRFFGNLSIDPHSISLAYAPGKFQLADPLIRQFAREIHAQMLKEGRLFVGPAAMRLRHFDINEHTATVQEADYGDQAGTSFALDYVDTRFSSWGGTLRQYWKSAYPSMALAGNPLGICLGVSAMLVIEEEKERFVLLVRRHGKLASLENSIGPSIAGSIDFRPGHVSLGEMLLTMLAEEMEEEIGLTRSEATLVPLAYAREILRGDRPQLFGVAITRFPRYQLKRLLQRKQSENPEFDSFFFARIKEGRIDSAYLEAMNAEARMTYFLAEEYFRVQPAE